MAFPNYKPPENPKRIGKVILYHRFLDAIRNADTNITSWIVLTPQGEFKVFPYHENEDDDRMKNQLLLETAVHSWTIPIDINCLGPNAADDYDAMRRIFFPFLDDWRVHKRLTKSRNRKKSK
mgnify:CR=1 FL=1